MSLAHLKRLQRLESRRPAERPWRDPGPAAIALLRWHLDCYATVDRVLACLIPVYGPHPEPSPAKAAVMRETDRIAGPPRRRAAWVSRARRGHRPVAAGQRCALCGQMAKAGRCVRQHCGDPWTTYHSCIIFALLCSGADMHGVVGADVVCSKAPTRARNYAIGALHHPLMGAGAPLNPIPR
jgi:hypothetical protein